MNLAGKVAVVTGAGSGIGEASARILAAQGAQVVVTDLNADAAHTVAAAISDAGGQAIAAGCDIEQEADIATAVDLALGQFGRLDIMHNNAALTAPEALRADGSIMTIDLALWDRMFDVNVRGTMLGCRHGVRAMRLSGGGSIINTSSMYGLAGFIRQPAYGVSKAAVNMLTAYVATAHGHENIRCNAVCPSMVHTPSLARMVPESFIQLNADSALTPFLGSPDDIANIVAFLASDASRYLTGQVIHADGGTTAHLPTVADARRYFKAHGRD